MFENVVSLFPDYNVKYVFIRAVLLIMSVRSFISVFWLLVPSVPDGGMLKPSLRDVFSISLASSIVSVLCRWFGVLFSA